MSDTDAIVVEGLTKAFRRQTAVDRVSFRVARGRFFGFLGPNGAGKSTTIRMLTGLLRPTAGDAVVDGVRLSSDLLALKRRIGVLTEELPLYERLSGEEHLLFAARMHGLPRPEARRRTEELLEFLSLADERGKLVVDYSQGMRKKLALACALVHGPSVLFLDEPLNGIDPVSGRVVSDLLRRLTARGVTLFFTSHALDVVERALAGAEKESIALMPLAVPMLADPGAISTTLIMLNRAATPEQKAAFYISLAAVIAAAFVILRLSVHSARRLSPIAQKMMGRLLGLLLCAMSVQFGINALRQMGVPLTL